MAEPFYIGGPGNEDWPKRTLDFEATDAAELLAELEATGVTLDEFKALPAYRLALESGDYPWLAEVEQPDPKGVAATASLGKMSIGELLGLSRRILAELRRRGVIRSGNAPAGDVAELLVQRATGGKLAANAQKSWDVETPAGEHLQVKARVVTNPKTAGERQLSVFRSWNFNAAVIVLFDDEFRVWRASRVAVEVLEEAARFIDHVSGYRVMATDALLDRGEDWTERLRAAAAF